MARNALHGLLEDLRYALRLLRRAPGFTGAALITLAIGIGANTTVFSIVRGVLLRPLPFEDSGRITTIWTQGGERTQRSIPLNAMKAVQQYSQSFEYTAAYQGAVVGGSRGEPTVSLAVVSEDFFKLFRVQPRIGRDFASDDLNAATPRVALISHEYWRNHFGGDADVLGKVIDVPEGFSRLTIIGVLPESLRSPFSLGNPESVWTLLAPEKGGSFRSTSVTCYLRLKPEVSYEQAQAELTTLQDRIVPAESGASHQRVLLQPLIENFAASSRTTILVFAGAVAAVLMIVIVNLVGLELSRLPKLEGELSIRTALGASRWRLMRLMLVKTLVVGLAGGTLGILAAAALHSALVNALQGISRKSDIHIDGVVLAVGFGLSLLSSAGIGLVPALRAVRLNVRDTIHSTAQAVTASRGMRFFQNSLMATETALALVLVIAAGLLINNLWRLLSEDLGFAPEGVAAVRYTLPVTYSTDAQRIGFFGDALKRIKGMSNIQSVAVTSIPPLLGGSYTSVRLPEAGSRRFSIQQLGVSSEYFSMLRIPVVIGRTFTEEEVLRAAPVTVVSATLAARLWPGKNPLGRVLILGTDTVSVIGVVGDVQYGFYSNIRMRQAGLSNVSSLVTERWTAYFPIPMMLKLDWSPARSAVFLMRTSGNTRDVAAVLQEMESKATVTPGSVSGFIAEATAQQRFQTMVLASFGATALLLAALGVYSVVTHSVVRRTREIGIRLALGARRSKIFTDVCRGALAPGIIGLLIGLAVSFVIRRVLTAYVSAIRPDDGPTYIVVLVTMFLVVLFACAVPARRAMKLDPITALRWE